MMNSQVNDVRRETAGMQRKILGSWKQYSGREFFGFFSVDSDKFLCFPAGYVRKSSEKIRKIPGGNTASIFQIFPVFPCTIRWFSCIFPARSCKIRWQERSPWVCKRIAANWSKMESKIRDEFFYIQNFLINLQHMNLNHFELVNTFPYVQLILFLVICDNLLFY